ncbi:MAG: hypothetical protein ACRD5K_00580 [Candidatus Acidiferrales bacterium]
MKSTITIGILACALLFFAAAYFWRAPRVVQSADGPKPWNTRAITSVFTGVKVRELDATHAAVDFIYDLENRTDRDYQLTPGPGAVVMRRLKADGSLSSDRDARLVSAAFVPINDRTRITMEMTESFGWPAKQDDAADQKLRDFVTREAAGLQGFVIFDQSSRYEIELPISLAVAQPSATPHLK